MVAYFWTLKLENPVTVSSILKTTSNSGSNNSMTLTTAFTCSNVCELIIKTVEHTGHHIVCLRVLPEIILQFNLFLP